MDCFLLNDVIKILNLNEQNSAAYIEYIQTSRGDGLSILVLHGDKYSKFLKLLTEIEQLSTIEEKQKRILDSRLDNLFVSLSKANIGGIKLQTPQADGRWKYFSFVEDAGMSECIIDTSFNFKVKTHGQLDYKEQLKTSLIYFQLGEFDSCISLIQNIISNAKKERNYVVLFTAVFNYNLILNYTNYYRSKQQNEKPDLIDLNSLIKQCFSSNTTQFDLLSSIFIDENNLAAYLVTQEKELEETKSRIRNVKNGGFSFTNQQLVSDTRLLNLVIFAENNNLLLSKNFYFNNSISVLLETIFLKQKGNHTFNRLQLFALIKFMDTEKLKRLLFDDEQKKHIVLYILNHDKNWIINEVLRNLKEAYLKINEMESVAYRYVDNLILILSNVKLEDCDLTILFNDLSEMVHKGKNTINIYTNINRFIGLQYNLFNTKFSENDVSRFIHSILNKLIYSANGYDQHGIKNYISNVFNINANVELIDDQNLIDKLLLHLSEDSSESLIKYENLVFLLSLYNICNQECKGKIKLKVTNQNLSDELESLIFKFMLINMKLLDTTDTETFLAKIKETIQGMIEKESFNSRIYEIDYQIKYATENKILEDYDDKLFDLKNLLDELIQQVNNLHKNLSNY